MVSEWRQDKHLQKIKSSIKTTRFFNRPLDQFVLYRIFGQV